MKPVPGSFVMTCGVFFASVCFSLCAFGTTYFVDASALGDGSGGDWSNACTTLGDAVAKATAQGDEIHVKGDLVQSNAVTIASHPGLAIRGGYTGDGETRSGRSRLVRDAKLDRFKIFLVSGSTVTFDGLSVEKGSWNVSGTYGQGVELTDACTAVFTNCAFAANNNNYVTSSYMNMTLNGGGIGANGGKLTIVDCDFSGNKISAWQTDAWGAGAFAYNASVTVKNSRFNANSASSNWGYISLGSHGAALGFRECASVQVDGCTFRTNTLSAAERSSGYAFEGCPGGAALATYKCPAVAVRDCAFFGDRVNTVFKGAALQRGNGHACNFYDSGVSLSRCVFNGAGFGGAAGHGVIDINGGTLAMTNVLVNAVTKGWCVGNTGGSIGAVNCTFTGVTAPDANRQYVAYSQYSGSAVFKDTIFWNLANGISYVNEAEVGELTLVNCTDTTQDPLFGDAYYCHPKSAAGRYTGGFFVGGGFTTNDVVTSPTIDAVPGLSALTTEPQPNGRHVNLGYDGNTATASKSVVDDDPTVDEVYVKVVAYADYTVPDATGVLVYGDLASTGGDPSANVWMTWDSADRGTAFESWAHRVPCGARTAWDFISAKVENPSGTVYYRFFAQNPSTQVDWSSPVRSLETPSRPEIAYGSPAVAARYRTSASIRVEVTDTSDLDTTVAVRYWLTSDPSVTNTVFANGGQSVGVGGTSVILPGLEKGTSYGYCASASNGVGVTTLAPQILVTKTDDEPLTVCAAPAAAGFGDGSSFANAMTLDAAFATTVGAGDELRLLEGDYYLTNGYAFADHPGLILTGGLAGDGTPGSGRSRLIRRTTAPSFQLMTFSASTVTVSGVSFENGCKNVSGTWGQGVGLVNGCDASFTNCAFLANDNRYPKSPPVNMSFNGGGIGCDGGKLSIDDCEFKDNKLSANNTEAWGAGAYARNASVKVKNSRFNANCVVANWGANSIGPHGAALGFNKCTDVSVDGCTFRTNYVTMSSGATGASAVLTASAGGGAVMVYQVPQAEIRNCLFFGDYCGSVYKGTTIKQAGSGHACQFWDSTVSLTRSVFHGSGNKGAAGNGFVDIKGTESRLFMTNVLMNTATKGWLLGSNGATVEAVNCTFVSVSKTDFTRRYPAYSQNAGAASFRNCIFWNLNADGLTAVESGETPVFADCTDTTVDPMFGDAYYCHPVSPAGRYAGGWFTGGVWVTTDTETATNVIDAVPGFAKLASEPQPNGCRVNLGYDGNAETASKSVLGSTPTVSGDELQIFAYPDRTVASTTETVVYGDVAATGGGDEVEVFLLWGATDGGTDRSAWDHEIACGQHAPWDLVQATIANASGTVWYRFCAVNGASETAWTDPVRSFKLASKPVVAYADPAVSHRYRTSVRVRLDLQETSDLDTIVSVTYWPSNETSRAQSVSASGGQPVPKGTVTVDLAGLVPGVSYTCRGEATSAMGTTTLETMVFSTVDESTPLELKAAPAATGLGDGSQWTDAMTVVDAFTQATQAGDEVRLLQGEFLLSACLVKTNNAGFALRGGYTGEGEMRSGRSRLVRDTSLGGFQVMRFSSATVTVDGVSIEKGGYVNVSGTYGQGVQLLNGCDATFTNCAFLANGNKYTYSMLLNMNLNGGGIGANGGKLTIVDCDFENNDLAANNTDAWGAGAFAYKADVKVKNSRFRSNYTHAHWGWNSLGSHGAALGFRECVRVQVDGCTFRTNTMSANERGTGYSFGGCPGGAALAAYKCPDVTVRGCAFHGDRVGTVFKGAALQIGNGHACGFNASTVSVSRCVFDGAGLSGSAGHGVIDINGGTLAMTNVLMTGTTKGWCVGNTGNGAIEAVNCTFTDVATGASTRTNAVYSQVSGTAGFVNDIFWNVPDGVVWTKDGTDAPVIGWSAAATALAGEKNVLLSASPLTDAATGDYTLRKGSGCDNVGRNSAALRKMTDLAGNPRVKGGKVDLGCYESDYYRGFTVIVK